MTLCCETLIKIQDMYERPFIWPLSIDPKTLGLKANGLSVMLHDLSSKGAPLKANQMTILLNYCPFCGTKLREENPDADKDRVGTGGLEPSDGLHPD